VRATLVLLHGGAGRPGTIIDRYTAGLEHGCRLLALHGTEPYATGRFGWPLEDAERVVLSQLSAFPWLVSPIVCGFSQGAGLAGHLAWTGTVDCIGTILVAPALGIRGVPIPSPHHSAVPTYLLVGTDDWALDDVRHAANALERSGVPVTLDERAGLGHEWPVDFDVTLLRAIDWILETKSPAAAKT
jgi:alpha-beta hydrolase superfamily lysophospholipase